ncbi:MAG: ArsR/SmtB family transcription factor [Acetanaerobacterium sp.]
MEQSYVQNARIFKALGDPRRAMIVDMLSCGELCACRILEQFEMSQSTLSHHMKLLCECGLVKAREEGKWTYYSLNEQTAATAGQFLRAITADTGYCICRAGETEHAQAIKDEKGCDGCDT